MNLADYLSDPKHPGRRADLVAAGFHAQLVWHWSRDAADDSFRQVPDKRCPQIESATGGLVTCEELRSDIRWVRVPDAEWKHHPAGRPCIDIAVAA